MNIISSAQGCLLDEIEIDQRFHGLEITAVLCEPFHVADLDRSIVLIAWVLKNGEYVQVDSSVDLDPPFARICLPEPTEIIIQIIGESGSAVVAYYDWSYEEGAVLQGRATSSSRD